MPANQTSPLSSNMTSTARSRSVAGRSKACKAGAALVGDQMEFLVVASAKRERLPFVDVERAGDESIDQAGEAVSIPLTLVHGYPVNTRMSASVCDRIRARSSNRASG